MCARAVFAMLFVQWQPTCKCFIARNLYTLYVTTIPQRFAPSKRNVHMRRQVHINYKKNSAENIEPKRRANYTSRLGDIYEMTKNVHKKPGVRKYGNKLTCAESFPPAICFLRMSAWPSVAEEKCSRRPPSPPPHMPVCRRLGGPPVAVPCNTRIRWPDRILTSDWAGWG